MASDAIRRFMGELKPATQVQVQAPSLRQVTEAVASVEPEAAPAQPAAGDPFAMLEAQFGKAVADQARAAASASVAAKIPTTTTIPAGIGESLMRMRLPDRPHKPDTDKLMSVNRRFMPAKFDTNGNGL